MKHLIHHNGNLLRIGDSNTLHLLDLTPPEPGIVPNDMDFVYQAKDFDGDKIPNKAPNSTFGDYLRNGTITLNGTGSIAYLSTTKANQDYLYKILTNTELDNIKAINNTYTFFIRVFNESSIGNTGGIMSTRDGGGFIYMIRSNGPYLQIHTSSGNSLGENFRLDVDRVYKIVVSGSTFYVKNLETGDDYTITYSTNRSMGNKMETFYAGYSGETRLDRFYAFAGIARATTDTEDQTIKDVLMNQSL